MIPGFHRHPVSSPVSIQTPALPETSCISGPGQVRTAASPRRGLCLPCAENRSHFRHANHVHPYLIGSARRRDPLSTNPYLMRITPRCRGKPIRHSEASPTSVTERRCGLWKADRCGADQVIRRPGPRGTTARHGQSASVPARLNSSRPASFSQRKPVSPPGPPLPPIFPSMWRRYPQ